MASKLRREQEFVIKRVETVNYWLHFDREQVIDAISFNLSEGDKAVEEKIAEKLSALTNNELLEEFREELMQWGEVFDYIIERSEKYGDVQSQDVSVELEDEGN